MFMKNDKNIKSETETVKEVKEEKKINPFTDPNNYIVQIIGMDGKPIKTILANNSTIRVIVAGNQSIATEIK
jgi:hypothetical protein